MHNLVWSDEYSVGVEELDAPHRKIVRTVNMLVATNGEFTSAEVLARALTRLSDCICDHFEREEQLLASWHYPGLETHVALHREQRRKIATFCLLQDDESVSVPGQALESLRDWWVNHILVEDMKYRAFLEELGAIEPREAATR